MAKGLTYYELATLAPDAVWRYEQTLGFIQPVFDAITHADNIRKNMSEDCLAIWSAKWTFDSMIQLHYFKMVCEKRGYVCRQIEDNQFGKRLETRLVA